MVVDSMQRVIVDGAQLALWDIGAGDPILFLHGGSGDECLAVIQEPALTENFRLIHFQRAGYAISGGKPGPSTIDGIAAQAKKVVDQLGIERMHVEGLSLGGAIALQYAHDYPERVQSLALLEPGIPHILGKYPDVVDALGVVEARYQENDRAGAVDAFLMELAGPNYKAELSAHLPPGWRERLMEELDVVFQNDSPAMNSWEFTVEHAARITCPVLNVTGERSRPYFHEIHELMKEWFPQAENVVLPDSTHFMLEMNPTGSARVLGEFFSKNPIK
ncbi:MAG: alpha/beta hydrolase [Sphaerobacteraceae bacterium]|nr:MAG: alpha/beta hydrolase [Sphaerobacteraceae bacterium]